jgi:hypothetical protein
MSKTKNQPKPGKICWNELTTTSVPAAKKFYTGLLGWKTQPFGKGMDYTVLKNGKDMIGGMMSCPESKKPARWIPYVFVADVDATVKKATKLKGKIAMPAADVPTVGRIAILIDPQGAPFGIITPKM